MMCQVARLACFVAGVSALVISPTFAQEVGDTANAELRVVHRWEDGTALLAALTDTTEANRLLPMIEDARARIVSFFGSPFPAPVEISIVPDRQAFTEVLRAAWGIPETACWMVGVGVADFLVVLSPRTWTSQACEHDPTDTLHVSGLVTHELVHAYHGQHNPSPDFDFEGAEDMGWFLEGLATYVSGQLDHGHLAPAREALQSGALPASLRDAWSGRYRYGVSGSLVEFIDIEFGRRILTEMLPMQNSEELLDALGLSEDEFLDTWTAWLRESSIHPS